MCPPLVRDSESCAIQTTTQFRDTFNTYKPSSAITTVICFRQSLLAKYMYYSILYNMLAELDAIHQPLHIARSNPFQPCVCVTRAPLNHVATVWWRGANAQTRSNATPPPFSSPRARQRFSPHRARWSLMPKIGARARAFVLGEEEHERNFNDIESAVFGSEVRGLRLLFSGNLAQQQQQQRAA